MLIGGIEGWKSESCKGKGVILGIFRFYTPKITRKIRIPATHLDLLYSIC